MTEPKIRALIVDDELLARRRLASLLADLPEITVIGEAEGGSAAVEAIVGRRPDLVFLDVQMPGLDGFGVLRCTAGAHRPAVIFVTAHDEHAIRAFEVQAVDYLLKPVTTDRFRAAVQRAVAAIRSGARADQSAALDRLLAEVGRSDEDDGARITIRSEGRVTLVSVNDLDWVEADGDRLNLHAKGRTHVLRGTMADLDAKLPNDRFVRVHRSIIVNRRRVRTIESLPKGDYVVVLTDGARLRTGRTYREAVQAMTRAGDEVG